MWRPLPPCGEQRWKAWHGAKKGVEDKPARNITKFMTDSEELRMDLNKGKELCSSGRFSLPPNLKSHVRMKERVSWSISKIFNVVHHVGVGFCIDRS